LPDVTNYRRSKKSQKNLEVEKILYFQSFISGVIIVKTSEGVCEMKQDGLKEERSRINLGQIFKGE